MTPRAVAPSFVLALSAAVLVGCSSGGGGSAAPTSAAPSGTASGSGTATPTSTAAPAALPNSCGELLPILDLDDALGVALVGRSAYIKGVAEPKINRTGRATCRYGITRTGNKTNPPKLEVGVSTYADEQSATDRVDATVIDMRTGGSTPSEVQVAGKPATVLIGVGPATLVAAAGTRTLVISLAAGVVKGPDTTKALIAVAELAMKNLP